MSRRREPKDYIGPTIGKRKVHCVPEGPIADLNSARSTKGVHLAKTLLGGDDPKVEGTPVKGPLQQTPVLPPGAAIPRPQPQKRGPELSVDPQAVVGMTHIDSYQTLMRNDRMEKPIVKGWQDEDS